MLAVSEAKSISNPAIPRMATGFCGGLAHTGGMCGAVAGAILLISLTYGRDSAADPDDPTYSRVQTLVNTFREHHGSTICPELIECDLSTEQGLLKFRQENRKDRCRVYVEDATSLVLTLME